MAAPVKVFVLTALVDDALAGVDGEVVGARPQVLLPPALGEAARRALVAEQVVVHRHRHWNGKLLLLAIHLGKVTIFYAALIYPAHSPLQVCACTRKSDHMRARPPFSLIQGVFFKTKA